MGPCCLGWSVDRSRGCVPPRLVGSGKPGSEGALARPTDRCPRRSRGLPEGALEVSRERPGAEGVARRFAHTPPEYPIVATHAPCWAAVGDPAPSHQEDVMKVSARNQLP